MKIKNATKLGYIEAQVGDGIDISSRMESHRGTVQKGLCQTLTCQGGNNVGVVVNGRERERERERESQDLQDDDEIRRLLPSECIMLMGWEKEDYESLVKAGLSDTNIYHVAGDGLITTIFGSLVNNMVGELNSHTPIITKYVNNLTKHK